MRFFCICVATILLSATSLYSQNEEPSQSRKEQRQERREAKRQEREERQSNKKENEEDAESSSVVPAPIANDEKDRGEAPENNSSQNSKEDIRPEQTTATPEIEPADSEENIKTEDRGSFEDSDNKVWIWWVIGIMVGLKILSSIFSTRCKSCGKFWAMREFDRTHLGQTKKEHVKDGTSSYYVYTNKYNIRRRCKHCGHEDNRQKTVRGK